MNPLNYGTREACQRLVDAGIVLETEFTWGHCIMKKADYWIIQPNSCHFLNGEPEYPAPSMAEVWRELHKLTMDFYLSIHPPETLLTVEPSIFKMTEVTYLYNTYSLAKHFLSTNPTDALIELLIWARKEKI